MGIVTKPILWWVISMTASLLIAIGCIQDRYPAPNTETTRTIFRDPPSQEALPAIVVLTPSTDYVKEIWSAMVAELTDSYNIVTIPIEANTTTAELGERIDAIKPSCVVIINNRTVSLYRELQNTRPGKRFPPAVVLMTSFLEQVIGTLRNATGIAYEVPAVSSFVALREVTTTPVRTVGVVHRAVFSLAIEKQAKLASIEKLLLVPAQVSDNPNTSEVKEALSKLMLGRHVDAIWVLNDNVLLSRKMLIDAWLPRLLAHPVPVVVGVPTLVREDVKLGSFAVLPDHRELGIQAARLILELGENNWGIVEHKVELPISVRTVANVAYVREHFGLRVDALGKIDEMVR